MALKWDDPIIENYRVFILRCLGLLGLAVWLGGFAFYGAVVVPTMHEAMSNAKAGAITQQVTITLNEIGAAALAACWLLVATERRAVNRRAGRTRIGLLAVSSAILVILIALHWVMDRRIETGSLRGFYPLHRAYLVASTVQWFANVGVLAASIWAWSPRRDDS